MKKSTIGYVVGSVVAAVALFAPKGTFTESLKDKTFEAKVVQATKYSQPGKEDQHFVLVQKDDGSLHKVCVDFERYAYLQNKGQRVFGRYSVFGTHVIDGLVVLSADEPSYMPHFTAADAHPELK
jgi:hypothetical protein